MDLSVTLQRRTATGRGNGRLRREGVVPGVVFGKGSESIPVQLDAKELETLYRAAGRTSIVRLRVEGDGDGEGPKAPRGAKSAIIRTLQRHPLTRRPVHVDFFLVDLTHEMQVDIPLAFVGEAPAVEATGGTLLTSLDHLKIRALPADLPQQIEVDVSGLVDLDAAIHVRDIVVDTEKVHILNDGEEMIAKVVPPRVEEEPDVPAAEEEEGAEPVEGEAAAAGEESGEGGSAERQEETGGGDEG